MSVDPPCSCYLWKSRTWMFVDHPPRQQWSPSSESSASMGQRAPPPVPSTGKPCSSPGPSTVPAVARQPPLRGPRADLHQRGSRWCCPGAPATCPSRTSLLRYTSPPTSATLSTTKPEAPGALTVCPSRASLPWHSSPPLSAPLSAAQPEAPSPAFRACRRPRHLVGGWTALLSGPPRRPARPGAGPRAASAWPPVPRWRSPAPHGLRARAAGQPAAAPCDRADPPRRTHAGAGPPPRPPASPRRSPGPRARPGRPDRAPAAAAPSRI
mmetsp:Transcript_5340/g.15473  ORF Transcript_5340/g.15473 Transcript_5340/m.15473 type:complete len:268 (-) Transcript_5340:486-1289(-)